MATNLKDLIDKLNAEDIPTNIFTIEDEDPNVILGKLNEVIAYLEQLQATINSSDSKANEALKTAKQAIADATQALSVANGIDDKATQALTNAVNAVATANTALNASNTALETANTALDTANTALDSSNSAVETANKADTTANKADTTANTANTTANNAKAIAEGIDNKATNALTNSNTAINTANSAKAIAEEAISQVVSGLGTKIYRDNELLSTLDVKPIEEHIANNTTAINNEATTRANAIQALDNAKVDKVNGKGLSTNDYTTSEKNKLAGLNNYNDTQVKADITALQTRATNIETKNTEQDTAIANEVTARTNADNNKADRNNPNQAIYANDITLQGVSMFNYCSNLGNEMQYKNTTDITTTTISTSKATYTNYAIITNTTTSNGKKIKIIEGGGPINISSLIAQNTNTAVTITIPHNTTGYTLSMFLYSLLIQGTSAVTNDYMNSQCAEQGSVSCGTNTTLTLNMRRAYSEGNVWCWLNYKFVLTQ